MCGHSAFWASLSAGIDNKFYIVAPLSINAIQELFYAHLGLEFGHKQWPAGLWSRRYTKKESFRRIYATASYRSHEMPEGSNSYP